MSVPRSSTRYYPKPDFEGVGLSSGIRANIFGFRRRSIHSVRAEQRKRREMARKVMETAQISRKEHAKVQLNTEQSSSQEQVPQNSATPQGSKVGETYSNANSDSDSQTAFNQPTDADNSFHFCDVGPTGEEAVKFNTITGKDYVMVGYHDTVREGYLKVHCAGDDYVSMSDSVELPKTMHPGEP